MILFLLYINKGTNFSFILLEKNTPNKICIPESFNTNIEHQLFDYKITFVNSKHENMISKGNLYSKTGFKRSF